MKNKTTKQELLGYVCDRLCKYRDKAEDQDELDDICCECEIEELVDGLGKCTKKGV